METMSASAYPVTPQSQISHMRSSQLSRSNPASAAQATRIMQEADSQQPPLSTPASQESFVSLQSAGSTVGPRLQTSSSNVSQLTTDTDLTSPTQSALEKAYGQDATSKADITRGRTPEGSINLSVQTEVYHAATSPMSITSPGSTNGAKRTASGHVKNAPSLPNTPLEATFAGRRARTDSLSSTGSRAGDLAMTLRARLGYAMAKVQHGWEHKNINEVENLAMHKVSPNRHSMSHLDYSRRPMNSGWSNETGRYSMYETNGPSTSDGSAFPPSKRHSGTYSSFVSSSQPTPSTGPRLQPAPDIRSLSSSQRHYQTAPSSQTNNHTNVMSPPRTPVNGELRRPPTIRTEMQTAEAERDALQALFQLGSPEGSQVPRHQNASQASSSQASPLRSEFATPRKVTFARSESDSSSRRLSSDDSSSGVRDHGMGE